MSKLKNMLVALLCVACVGVGSAFAACDNTGDNSSSSSSSATSTTDSSSTESSSPAAEEATVSSVKISGDTSVAAGSTITLKATVTMSDSSTYSGTIEWSSSDTSVATVSGGTVTGVKAGTATITATAGGKSDTYSITVTEATATDPTPSESTKYSAVIGNFNDNSQFWTDANSTVYFNADGTYTTDGDATTGIISWTGRSSDNDTYSYSNVSITGSDNTTYNGYIYTAGSSNKTYRYFAIDLSEYSGKNISITVVATSGGSSSRSIQLVNTLDTTALTSSSGALASYTAAATSSFKTVLTELTYEGTVSDSALYIGASNGFYVYAINIEIGGTISTTSGSTTSSYAIVTDKVAVGCESTFTTTGSTGTITWGTSNSEVATISSEGIVTGVATGEVIISAKVGNVVTATAVTVSTANLVIDDTASYAYTENGTVDLTNYISSETTVPSSAITWSTTDTDKASISGSTLTMLGSGNVSITATCGNLSDELTLTLSTDPIITAKTTSINVLADYTLDITDYFELVNITTTGVTGAVTQNSSSNNDITVSATENAISMTVSSSASGEYTVTIQSSQNSNVYASITVNVVSSLTYAVNFSSTELQGYSFAASTKYYFAADGTTVSTAASDGVISYYGDSKQVSVVKDDSDNAITINNQYTYAVNTGGKSSSSSRYFAIDLSAYTGKSVTISAVFTSNGSDSRSAIIAKTSTDSTSNGLTSVSSSSKTTGATVSYTTTVSDTTTYYICGSASINIYYISVVVSNATN